MRTDTTKDSTSNTEGPKSVGVIIDGNRRWARERGKPTLAGHTAGFERVKDLIRWAQELGIEQLFIYGFSTENWKRSEEEKGHLFGLFRTFTAELSDTFTRENVRIRFCGQIARFPEDIQESIRTVQEKTAECDGITVAVMLSYGGRAEIAAAAAAAAAAGEVSEETLTAHLWTAGMPDPDLIIRTGGEQRLSNFLLWQGAYSELFFIDTYWPDFSRGIFEEILAEYAKRERRMGK